METKESIYLNFVKRVEEKINSEEFAEKLKEVQKIDSAHWKKKIKLSELKNVVNEYKDYLDKEDDVNKKIRIILNGNPEIILRLLLEAVRQNVCLDICMFDFCYGQNLLIFNEINDIISKQRINLKMSLNNMIHEKELISMVGNFDRNVVIGNSNLYFKLIKYSPNFEFIPFGNAELYYDSEKFEDIVDKILDVAEMEGFYVEDYSDLDFNDAIKLMKKNGLGFESILFTEDKNKIKEFKENVEAENLIVNANPFSKIKFDASKIY